LFPGGGPPENFVWGFGVVAGPTDPLNDGVFSIPLGPGPGAGDKAPLGIVDVVFGGIPIGAPIGGPPPPPPPFLSAVKIGALLSLVTAFFNFFPFWIEFKRAPLSPLAFATGGGGPGGGGGPPPGGGGGPPELLDFFIGAIGGGGGGPLFAGAGGRRGPLDIGGGGAGACG